MINYLKYLYFEYYQRANYNIAQFAAEYEKAGRFVNNFLALATFLAVRNVNIPTWIIITSYPLLMIFAAYMGHLLVKSGVPKFNNSLGNQQSPELMKILDQQKKILKLLNKCPKQK